MIFLICILLSGCKREDVSLSKALELRENLISSQSCTFDTEVTCEYNDLVYQFQLSCIAQNDILRFTVTSPESIAGIEGSISNSGAELEFNDTALAFPPMAEGRISPVSAPWLFYKTLTGGYLHGCGKTEDGILISIDDSYESQPLHLQIYTDSDYNPILAEIYWQQQKIITLRIQNFSIM